MLTKIQKKKSLDQNSGYFFINICGLLQHATVQWYHLQVIHTYRITERHWFTTRVLNQLLFLVIFYIYYMKMISLDLTCCNNPYILVTKAPDFCSKDFFCIFVL